MTSDHSPICSVFEIGTLNALVPKKIGTFYDKLFSCPSQGNSLIGIFDLWGRNLPGMDASGYSDPYVVFEGSFLVRMFHFPPILTTKRRNGKTSTKYKTLNPNWIGSSLFP